MHVSIVALIAKRHAKNSSLIVRSRKASLKTKRTLSALAMCLNSNNHLTQTMKQPPKVLTLSMIDDTTLPCAIYNTERQELIAIFSSRVLLRKYMFSTQDANKASRRICMTIRNKSAVRANSNDLQLRIAIRSATTNQIATLGDADFKILVDYIPQPNPNHLKSFHGLEPIKEQHFNPKPKRTTL